MDYISEGGDHDDCRRQRTQVVSNAPVLLRL